jgi:hypothetical protein
MLLFALLTYGLVFLIADARIFGCDAKLWNSGGNPEEDCRDVGVFKIRQNLLKHSFFAHQLGCYFCVGCWTGPMAYWLLHFAGATQALPGADTLMPAIAASIASVPLGGACALILDVVVSKLEINAA